MQVLIQTDNHIEGHERMNSYYTTVFEDALKRFEDKIMKVEVHLGDENSDKTGGDDKRCSVEVRLAGHQPVAAVNHSDTIDKAVNGAIDKLKRVLGGIFDKMKHH